MRLKLLQLRSKKLKIVEKLPKSTTIHSSSNSRSNRNCIICMKWCKRLLFLPCCLRFLTHSGNEKLYQSYLYLGGANINHQTIYSGNVTITVPVYKNLAHKKQGHQSLGKLLAMAGLVPIFLANYVARINTHALVSIQYYWAINFRVFLQN